MRHAHEFRNGHHYFYSWRHRATSRHERDWLDARNICRKHCQDLVSLEDAQESKMIEDAVARDNVRYIWTSGRKCDFDDCDRADLQVCRLTNGSWRQRWDLEFNAKLGTFDARR